MECVVSGLCLDESLLVCVGQLNCPTTFDSETNCLIGQLDEALVSPIFILGGRRGSWLSVGSTAAPQLPITAHVRFNVANAQPQELRAGSACLSCPSRWTLIFDTVSNCLRGREMGCSAEFFRTPAIAGLAVSNPRSRTPTIAGKPWVLFSCGVCMGWGEERLFPAVVALPNAVFVKIREQESIWWPLLT